MALVTVLLRRAKVVADHASVTSVSQVRSARLAWLSIVAPGLSGSTGVGGRLVLRRVVIGLFICPVVALGVVPYRCRWLPATLRRPRRVLAPRSHLPTRGVSQTWLAHMGRGVMTWSHVRMVDRRQAMNHVVVGVDDGPDAAHALDWTANVLAPARRSTPSTPCHPRSNWRWRSSSPTCGSAGEPAAPTRERVDGGRSRSGCHDRVRRGRGHAGARADARRRAHGRDDDRGRPAGPCPPRARCSAAWFATC